MEKYKIEIKENRKKVVKEFYLCTDVGAELSTMFEVLERILPPTLKRKVNLQLKKEGVL